MIVCSLFIYKILQMAILDNKKRGLYAKEVKNSPYICPLSAQSPRSSAR